MGRSYALTCDDFLLRFALKGFLDSSAFLEASVHPSGAASVLPVAAGVSGSNAVAAHQRCPACPVLPGAVGSRSRSLVPCLVSSPGAVTTRSVTLVTCFLQEKYKSGPLRWKNRSLLGCACANAEEPGDGAALAWGPWRDEVTVCPTVRGTWFCGAGQGSVPLICKGLWPWAPRDAQEKLQPWFGAL